MKEREYDRMANEGGEGYNPYRAERERKEWEESQKAAKAYAATTQGQIDALYRRIERECGSVAREWGNGDAIETLRAELYAQIKVLETRRDDEFLAAGGWTAETTTERRATWNARVTKGEFNKGKSVDMGKLRAAEKAQGWTLDQLKKAIEVHKNRPVIIENPKPATKAEIMKRAWQIAREGAKAFGGSSKLYFAEALRQAWAESRMSKAA